jgi:hypothetical protein
VYSGYRRYVLSAVSFKEWNGLCEKMDYITDVVNEKELKQKTGMIEKARS